MPLKQTPFYPLHQDSGARMGEFAGWDMPIQYPQGILAEHQQCRTSAALFDTSHMGEFVFKGDIEKSGLAQAVTFPVQQLPVGRCRYGLMLNESGGILDDLIIYRISPDELFIVVNAGTIEKDFHNLQAHLSSGTITNISADTAKLDLQGPASRDILTPLLPAAADLRYFHHVSTQWNGQNILLSRTGYTGELGFELYGSPALLIDIARVLTSAPEVCWAGLGARDVLRLEVGYPLYGHDMDENTHPLACGLDAFVDMQHSFTGRDALHRYQSEGILTTRIAFRTTSRRSPRSHFTLLGNDHEIGQVSSGTYSPQTGSGIGIGLADKNWNKPGLDIKISDGKSAIDAVVCTLPFYTGGSLRK